MSGTHNESDPIAGLSGQRVDSSTALATPQALAIFDSIRTRRPIRSTIGRR